MKVIQSLLRASVDCRAPRFFVPSFQCTHRFYTQFSHEESSATNEVEFNRSDSEENNRIEVQFSSEEEDRFEANLDEVKEVIIHEYRKKKANDFQRTYSQGNGDSLHFANVYSNIRNTALEEHAAYIHPYFTISKQEHEEMAKEIEEIEAERIERGAKWEQERLKQATSNRL